MKLRSCTCTDSARPKEIEKNENKASSSFACLCQTRRFPNRAT